MRVSGKTRRLALAVALGVALSAAAILRWGMGGESAASPVGRADGVENGRQAILDSPGGGEGREISADAPDSASESPRNTPAPETVDAAPWEDTREFYRDIVIGADESVERGLVRSAQKWPAGVDCSVVGVPIPSCEGLNPEGKAIGPTEAREILRIVEDFNPSLRRMGEDAFFLYEDALTGYYEAELFERFLLTDYPDKQLPKKRERPVRGHYNKTCTVACNGWIVRVDFDSIDWPEFDSHMAAIKQLRQDRNEAVLSYISGL